MEKFYIAKKDGGYLSALKTIPQDAQYMLIACHGFLGGKENRGRIFPFSRQLNGQGFGVLAFDFTGCGESPGEFAAITLERQIKDLETVTGYVQKEIKLPIILLGRSFGGSTVISLEQNLTLVAGYVLWSAAIDLINTFKTFLGPKYYMLENGQTVWIEDGGTRFELKPGLVAGFKKVKPEDRLLNLKSKPVFICHGRADEVVDHENAVYAHERLPLSTLRLVKEADHSFTDFVELREEITLEWLTGNFIKNR